jgi:transglutaminase-like putative cysteine protease
VTYDVLQGRAWSIGEPSSVADRAAGEELLAGTADAVDPTARRALTISVTPQQRTSLVVAPGTPLRLDGPSRIHLAGAAGWLGSISRPSASDPYTVTSLVPASAAEGGPTEVRLRTAGTTYPDGMLERYGRAAVPAGTFTRPESTALLERVTAAGGATPFDLAETIVRTLHDPAEFTYDVDVSDLPCDAMSIVDCFAVYRRGFCEYYASTMVMLLRQADVPARLVEGFLPGDADPATRIRTVRQRDAHAWVQVYFPGYGWIDFDPTGGGIARRLPTPEE